MHARKHTTTTCIHYITQLFQTHMQLRLFLSLVPIGFHSPEIGRGLAPINVRLNLSPTLWIAHNTLYICMNGCYHAVTDVGNIISCVVMLCMVMFHADIDAGQEMMMNNEGLIPGVETELLNTPAGREQRLTSALLEATTFIMRARVCRFLWQTR